MDMKSRPPLHRKAGHGTRCRDFLPGRVRRTTGQFFGREAGQGPAPWLQSWSDSSPPPSLPPSLQGASRLFFSEGPAGRGVL